MSYALAVLVILGTVVGISLLRGQYRRVREMEALRAVMHNVMDEGPEGSQGEDR